MPMNADPLYRLSMRREMVKSVKRSLFLYLVLLVVLVVLQVTIDRDTRQKHSLQLDYSDNKYAYTFSSCPTKEHRVLLQTLPKAHRAFPPRESSATKNTCAVTLPESSDYLQLLCNKMFNGTSPSSEERKWLERNTVPHKYTVAGLLRKTTDCKWVRNEFNNNFFISEEEKAFPIAYAINLNKVPHQVFRLLKLIYRPHNVYCIHHDLKSDRTTKQIVFNVASCLDNVIITRKIEDVYWGWYTLEEAYLNCFTDLMLLRDNYPWKYVITLCGKEVPLRTNAETVSLLDPLNGMSSVQLVGSDGLDQQKYTWKYHINKMMGWITKKDVRLPPIPEDLKVYKSWTYMALSIQFVEFILCSEVGIRLREFMHDIKVPEENYFAMLFMKSNVPGGYRPQHEQNIFPVTSYIWTNGDHHGILRRIYLTLFPGTICSGRIVHSICMISTEDLHRISYKPGVLGYQSDDYLHPERSPTYRGKDRGPLFQNRYIMDWNSVVMDCMEQELKRRNILEHHSKCNK